jgi:hypothetical protein
VKGLYAHLYSSNYASFDDVAATGDEAVFEMHT